MVNLKKRSQVRKEDTWNMTDIYATDDSWRADFNKTTIEVRKAFQWKGTLHQGPSRLKAALDWYYSIRQSVEKLVVYAKQKSDEDTTNNHYQNLSMRARSLSVEVSSNTAFLEPEILSLGESKLRKMLKESSELQLYKRIIEEMIRQNTHTLTLKEEVLLAEVEEISTSPANAFYMFNNADIKFRPVWNVKGEQLAVTHGSYGVLLEDKDRQVRKDAFASVYSSYGQFKNLLASIFSANIKQAIFYAKARNYTSTREYYLDSGNIPESVYDNLIDTIHKNIHLMHRYVSLRKKMLNLDELHMYDIYVPLVPESTKRYSFEEAKQLVKEGLQPLGKDYVSYLQEGFDNRWIDVYENIGKKSGAYSWGCYEVHPYVLLNYNETLDNVFTLAHEMGHAMHSYYSNSTQPYIYSGYRIFVAEVASTCNEALLIQYMLNKTTDKKEKMLLFNHFLESFKGTVYRQTMFAEFERDCHRKAEKGESLTAETLCGSYYDLNKFYFGEDMVSDPEIALEWSRIPHFYTPFYVYQYATGFSAAVALSEKILTEGEVAVENYKRFLKAGGAMDPIDELKMAGVDMTSPEPIQKALNLFDKLLTEMETLYEEIK